MSVVVDASVAIKWFVREPLQEAAFALARQEETLLAPDLLIAEVTNAAWKKVARGEIDPPQAYTIAAAIGRNGPRLYSSAVLNEQALRIALALNHSVYDCLYLACAELAEAVLVTADARLCDAVAGGPYAGLVRHLSEVTA
ncbi:MAG: type II toxin-antitoxin system VapC family toxin [Alphaproteobacteria bacterium]